jgi:acetoin utilization protein AcuB
MQISDVMTTNVVSISSDTSITKARRIMDGLGFRRLPVIDRGKLVGIITKDGLDKSGPSNLASVRMHELPYVLDAIKVRTVMHREVVTAPPNTYIDDAIALVQSKRVGMLIVVDGDLVVGVATTNDIFYKIVNPILGVKMNGTRIYVNNCVQASDIKKIMAIVEVFGIRISTQFSINIPEFNTHDLVIQLDSENCSELIKVIQNSGYQVVEKQYEVR